MGSVVAAYTVAWTVLIIYVATLAARQRRLRHALEQLESRSPAPPGPESHAR
ncbi:MAG: CcmD family protein [Terriglobales bacterium]